MYGFHKIPQLQQGVLKSESDVEIWNFAHPHFRRGEPHLLNFIQRKRQAAQATQGEGILEGVTTGAGVIGTIDFHDPTNGASGGATASGQVLDIQSIMNGISAIKRHQSIIQGELSDIKQTNQLLWQDAMDVRAKYQKQQDTINRIVKFLAGVFGNRTTSPHKDDGVEALNTRAVIPRRRTRLLIEDGQVKKAGVTEAQEKEEDEAIETQFLMPDELYASVETPVTVLSPAPSDNNSTFTTETSGHFGSYDPSQPQTPSMPPPSYPQPAQPIPIQPQSQTQQLSDPADHTLTPSRSPNPSQSFDIQNALSQLTPQQISQLLSVTFSPFDAGLPDNHGAAPTPASSQLTSYQPSPFDFSHLTQPNRDEHEQDLISFDSASPGLETQWKVTDDLDQEVNILDSSIHSFMQEMQNMGLDPQHLDVGAPMLPMLDSNQPSLPLLNVPPPTHLSHPPQPSPTSTSPSSLPQMPSVPLCDPPNAHDNDFDEMYNFLNLGRDDVPEDAGGDPSTAFLDDMQVLPELDRRASASPVSSRQSIGKRKSDVALSEVQMEVPAPPAPEPAPSKQPPKRGGVKMNMNASGTTRPAKRRKK